MLNDNRVLLQNQHLLPVDLTYINHTYGVLLNYPEKAISLHYEIECKFCKYNDDAHFLFLLNRKQVFINDEIPEIKLYQMADQMAKAFYPIILCVNNADKKISNIANYPEVALRCQQTYHRLNTTYDGDFASTFCQQYYKQYSNPNILTGRLENELFYKLYFFPLYSKYSHELIAESEFRFPFNTEDEDPLLKIIHRMEADYTTDHKIVVNLNCAGPVNADAGKINDHINFEAQYHLYADDHTISSIKGKAAYKSPGGEKSHVEFEVYHLDPEKRIKQPNIKTQKADAIAQSGSFIIESTEGNRKKSFWSIFN